MLLRLLRNYNVVSIHETKQNMHTKKGKQRNDTVCLISTEIKYLINYQTTTSSFLYQNYLRKLFNKIFYSMCKTTQIVYTISYLPMGLKISY